MSTSWFMNMMFVYIFVVFLFHSLYPLNYMLWFAIRTCYYKPITTIVGAYSPFSCRNRSFSPPFRHEYSFICTIYIYIYLSSVLSFSCRCVELLEKRMEQKRRKKNTHTAKQPFSVRVNSKRCATLTKNRYYKHTFTYWLKNNVNAKWKWSKWLMAPTVDEKL